MIGSGTNSSFPYSSCALTIFGKAKGSMKTILIENNNKIKVLVDDEDYEELISYSWYLNNSGYASAKIGGKFVLMHRLIMKANPGQEIDHINNNKLDNRKTNLHFCTRSQNLAKRNRPPHNSSGYKGVSYCCQTNKYRAYIQYKGKHIAIGRFLTAVEAAKAYNKKAVELYGEYSSINEVNNA